MGIMVEVDILFIIPPFHMRNGGGKFFPMGTGYIISSLEKRGYTWGSINCTEIISSFYDSDLKILETKLSENLKDYSPAVIGIGPCITTQLKALKRIASVCKKTLPNVTVFAGGPFASIGGQEYVFNELLGIEYLIKGDGEDAVPDAIDAVKEHGSIRYSECVSYRGHTHVNVVSDLNSLMFPYRIIEETDSFSLRRKSVSGHQAPMIASRGCPYKCNYCVSGNMKASYIPYRKRSYQNILLEMIYLKKEFDIENVIFYDDCFFANRSKINDEVIAFCKMLIYNQIVMHWQIEMRPDFFMLLSNNSVKRLVEAGCTQINVGIEKISQSGLAFLGKEGNLTGLKEKVQIVKKIGIKVSATFILGGEGECEDDIIKLIEYAKKLSLEFAHFNPLFIYPGTPLYNKVFKTESEWAEVILNDGLPWGEIVYENEHLDKEHLLRLIDYAYAEFYKDTPFAHIHMIEDRFNIKKK